jgi:RNA polymerase sigma factor (sigma-70 family)
MTPDSELLRQFARTNSQDAFAELVKRHVNLVYSAALRQMNGDGHLAKDVSQTVFTDLARKADSLSRRESLTGWLYTSAHFAAAKIVRGENRRRDREEKFMREPTHETVPDASRAEALAEAGWEKLRPTLDDAMHELKEPDREAVLLRYFENRQFAEVGAKLGLNENAARMRVERALEKLRAIFVKRGIKTATAFATVISANAIQIAPTNLAATLTTTSIATAGTGTFTLLKIMTATKLKLGISALIVAGAATAFVIQHQAQEKLRTQNESLTQQLAQLQTDNENLSNRLAAADDSKKLPEEQFNELLKLRGEVGVLRQQNVSSQKLRTGSLETSQTSNLVNDSWMNTENARNDLNDAIRSYWEKHNQELPTDFEQLKEYFPTNSPGYFVERNKFEFLSNIPIKRQMGTNGIFDSKIYFRERVPRQIPNGDRFEQVRIYGFIDGEIFELHSEWLKSAFDEDFDTFERQHSISSPNQ